MALSAQPQLPGGLPTVIDVNGAALQPPTAGVYLAELGMWSRHVTALDDGGIREVAVPGTRHNDRVQTVWQVRLVRVGDTGAAIACGTALPSGPRCGLRRRGGCAPRRNPATTARRLRGARRRRLPRCRQPALPRRDPARGSPAPRRSSGPREQSVQARWIAQNGNRLGVEIPDHDVTLGFAPADWVELVDDRHELGGLPGTIVQIATVHDDIVEINPATAQAGVRRRHRHRDDGSQSKGPALGRPAAADDGHVRRPGAGSRWRSRRLARMPLASTGRSRHVPRCTTCNGRAPGASPTSCACRAGHAYRRLAVLGFDGTAWSVLEDCRALFPPLTALVTLGYAGGDGQHAAPDPANTATLVALGQQLRASVTNGNIAVAGGGWGSRSAPAGTGASTAAAARRRRSRRSPAAMASPPSRGRSTPARRSSR